MFVQALSMIKWLGVSIIIMQKLLMKKTVINGITSKAWFQLLQAKSLRRKDSMLGLSETLC